MTTEQIDDILQKHKLWLDDAPGGTRADLRGAVLTRAVLTRAVLRGAVLRGAVLRDAVLRGADMRGADLRGADMRGADLTRAVLAHAVLAHAVLRDAVLRGADMRGADLRGADMRGADLTRAVLAHADLRDAVLADAVLRNAVLTGADIPVVPDLDRQILAAIEAGGTLEMSTWHTCDTTHCRAGWAVVVAGEPGAALERAVGTSVAAALMYAAIRPDGRVPDFYASNKDAMADIRRCAALPLESRP